MGIGEEVRVFGWLRARPLVSSIVIGVFGLLVVVVGILGVRSSAADASTLQQLRAGDGISVEGTLDGAETATRERAPGLPDKVSYCPRYSYEAADGVQRILVDRDHCVSNKKQLTNQTVRILFDRDDPDSAFIDEPGAGVGRSAFAIFAWLTLVVGVAITTTGIVRLARGGRRSSSSRHVDPTFDAQRH